MSYEYELFLSEIDTIYLILFFFFFSSRRRHTRLQGDWSSDVCSSDLEGHHLAAAGAHLEQAHVFGPGAVRRIGLHAHAVGAPKAVEVVGVQAAQVDRKSVV